MRRSSSLFVLSLAFLSACADDGRLPLGDTEEAVTNAMYAVKLLNEGTCQFLACCSSFSTQARPGDPGSFVCANVGGYAPGTANCDPGRAHVATTSSWIPSFACGGTCGGDWISGPAAQAPCGQTFTICHGGATFNAPVKDHADSHGQWEVSSGLYQSIAPGNDIVHIYANPADPAIATDPLCAPQCPAGQTRKADGTCCDPCNGGTQVCGLDTCGSGRTCGTCPAGQTCDASNTCKCTTCSGQTCGWDHCGTGTLCGGELCGPVGPPTESCGDGRCDYPIEDADSCPEDCGGGGGDPGDDCPFPWLMDCPPAN